MASAHGERLTLPMIAKRAEAPRAFVAKVLQDLSRAGILDSYRGPNGGFDLLPEKAATVNLRMVMNAVGEDLPPTKCAMGIRECGVEDPCPMHHSYMSVKAELMRMLDETYVRSLVEALGNE